MRFVRPLLLVVLVPLIACAQISMGGGISASGGIITGTPQFVDIFGDSIGTGAGANAPILVNGYSGQVASNYGWPQLNIAVGGTTIGAWAQYQNGVAYDAPPKGIALTIFGVAEVFSASQGTPIDYTVWSPAAMANILHSAIAVSEHVNAGSVSWTLSGSWTKGNATGNTSGIPTYDRQSNELTTQVGATASVHVTGTTVYLVYLAQQPTADVSFNVSIDGSSKGNFPTLGNVGSAGFSGGSYPFYTAALRFPGLSGGSHTVLVTYVSGTTPLIIQFAAGNTLTNHPRYFVGNCLPESPDSIPTDIATYNSNLSTIVTNLASDGLAVYPVNTHDAVNPATDFSSNLHPNQAGYTKLATVFESVIDAHPGN